MNCGRYQHTLSILARKLKNSMLNILCHSMI